LYVLGEDIECQVEVNPAWKENRVQGGVRRGKRRIPPSGDLARRVHAFHSASCQRRCGEGEGQIRRLHNGAEPAQGRAVRAPFHQGGL